VFSEEPEEDLSESADSDYEEADESEPAVQDTLTTTTFNSRDLIEMPRQRKRLAHKRHRKQAIV